MSTGNDKQQSLDEIIVPTEFTPLEKSNHSAPNNLNRNKTTVIFLLLIFTLLLAFIFSARPVQILVSPSSAEIDIDGGLIIPINGRYLMVSGDYTVTASAKGYHDKTTSFHVGKGESNQLEINLNKLAGALTISSSPEGAAITIDGQERGLTTLKELPLEAGTHNIKLYAERHQILTENIEVQGMGIHQQLQFKLQPAWADVLINSTPSGAEISIDGENIGKTPMRAEIMEGERQLSLSLIGYKVAQIELVISAGIPQDLGVIQLQREDALLRLKTLPEAANIILNGVYQGTSPLDIPLSPTKEHNLTIFKSGYHNQQKTIRLGNKLIKELNISLRPALAKVRISTQPKDAEILIDGKLHKTAEGTLELPSHEHRLEVRKPGFQSHLQTFTPKPGLEQLLTITLSTKEQARIAALKPTWTTSGGQLMALMSPGSFTMGASRREPGRRSNEVLRPVKLDRLFYLAKHEVSNEQFLMFQSEHQSGQVQGNSLEGDKQPVVKVSWEQAAQYCNWLSKKDGLKPFYIFSQGKATISDHSATGYRLPTEAEWAWASRSQGNNMLKFPWGRSLPPPNNSGNYADKSSAFITRRAINDYVDNFIVTAPVGSFSANSRGLHDLGGNVAEWTNDYYGTPSSTGELQLNPTGPKTGSSRVIRGSSWAHGTVTELRLSYRDYGNQGRDDVGFRLARYAE